MTCNSHIQRIPPLQINMEPKHHTIEKENYLNQTSIIVFQPSIFNGVSCLKSFGEWDRFNSPEPSISRFHGENAWLFQQSFKRVPDIVVSSLHRVDFVQCFGSGISSKCSAKLQFFAHVDVQSGHHRIETRMGTNTARDLSKHRRSGRAQTIRDKNITGSFMIGPNPQSGSIKTPRNEATWRSERTTKIQLKGVPGVSTTNDSVVEGYLSSSHPPLYQNSILLTKTFAKGCSTMKHPRRPG